MSPGIRHDWRSWSTHDAAVADRIHRPVFFAATDAYRAILADMTCDRTRARQIVRLAAKDVKSRAARAWLIEDSRGTFERDACVYLEKLAAGTLIRPGVAVTDAQIDAAIAGELALSALTAVRDQAVRDRDAPRPRRRRR